MNVGFCLWALFDIGAISEPISCRVIFPLKIRKANSLITRKPKIVKSTAERDSVKRCPIIPIPTNFAVIKLIISESIIAMGSPITKAKILLIKSSAINMEKSLPLRIPSIKYTPNSCLRR